MVRAFFVDLGFGLQPIFDIMAVLAAVLLVEFVGPAAGSNPYLQILPRSCQALHFFGCRGGHGIPPFG